MVAGGLTFAVPGVMPDAFAANDDLSVSAEEVGNFAGIQVIEIVVDDPDRSDTDTSEGRPNVEINGDDVYMAQGTDGAWYAYVANEIAIDNYNSLSGYSIADIYNHDGITTISNSDALQVYANATIFLDGFKNINTVENNDQDAEDNWPFIQSYDISDNTDVTITYGSGSTAQIVVIEYDYDDTKDITLDRQYYPKDAQIYISLDDSLLNLSPTADQQWIFNLDGTSDPIYYLENGTSPIQNEVNWEGIGFDDEGPITVDNSDNVLLVVDSKINDDINETDVVDGYIILKADNSDDNLFVNYDNNDNSGLRANQEGEGSIEYNDAHSVILDTFTGTIEFLNTVDEWFSGVELSLELVDEDRNLTSRSDETISILDGEVPYIEIGDPVTIDQVTSIQYFNSTDNEYYDLAFDLDTLTGSKTLELIVPENSTSLMFNATWSYPAELNDGTVFTYINFDVTDFDGPFGLEAYDDNDDLSRNVDDLVASYEVDIDTTGNTGLPTTGTVYFDILSFGQVADITSNANGDIDDNIDRVNDAIYRFELEETDNDTAKYKGSVEYIMINQLNVFDEATYESIKTADDKVVIIVNDDLDGTDAVTVSYLDIDSSNTDNIISVKEDANTHTGVIELDKTSYSSGNTIQVTLIDADLNTNSDTIQSYDVDESNNWVGNENVWLSQLKIDGTLFDEGNCGDDLDIGLYATEFTLTETDDASGIFVGTLKLPTVYCDNGEVVTTNGLDVEFEYQDYSDSSGEPNETSESASIRSNTGSVSLDSTVYPVPFSAGDFETYDGEEPDLGIGSVIVTIQVNDSDFNISASGEDTLSSDYVTLEVSRGSLDYEIPITISELVETDGESGIFEVEVEIAQGSLGGDFGINGDINQGDILAVTYKDPNDASGDENTVTDSATFDLRNAVLQTDKQVYIIGSDAIITLIEPDLNLDTGNAETWSLDLVNWDSDAGDVNLSDDIFDAQPAGFRETGDDTGIFQVIIEIPEAIGGDRLDRGESITLEYQDNGPAGADYIGDDDEDISVEIFTSDFGASVSLDQKVYTWTDKVYVTIVSPDHNFDSDSIDEIGDAESEINVSTREDELELYKLVETGPDTGIFTGEIILTGYASHDADGDGILGDAPGDIDENGPTSGRLPAGDNDGLSVFFESSDGKTVTGSSLIRWNIGEVQFLEASYPASGNGVIRVIDPDMNWNPESVDSFEVDIWSDTAVGGISLRVTETNEATGIFEGSVFFTTTQGSSGSRLAVSEGDTITAEYEDNTLPSPYSTADELPITATANIGTIVPPLERAPAGNLRAVDAFGNSLSGLSVDQQVQLEAQLHNGQDRDQEFAYLVQIQDGNGVTVSLAWITGDLTPNQSFAPALSWIPQQVGEYTATAFVWESVSNPTALSPPISTTLSVG